MTWACELVSVLYEALPAAVFSMLWRAADAPHTDIYIGFVLHARVHSERSLWRRRRQQKLYRHRVLDGAQRGVAANRIGVHKKKKGREKKLKCPPATIG